MTLHMLPVLLLLGHLLVIFLNKKFALFWRNLACCPFVSPKINDLDVHKKDVAIMTNQHAIWYIAILQFIRNLEADLPQNMALPSLGRQNPFHCQQTSVLSTNAQKRQKVVYFYESF